MLQLTLPSNTGGYRESPEHRLPVVVQAGGRTACQESCTTTAYSAPHPTAHFTAPTFTHPTPSHPKHYAALLGTVVIGVPQDGPGEILTLESDTPEQTTFTWSNSSYALGYTIRFQVGEWA